MWKFQITQKFANSCLPTSWEKVGKNLQIFELFEISTSTLFLKICSSSMNLFPELLLDNISFLPLINGLTPILFQMLGIRTSQTTN